VTHLSEGMWALLALRISQLNGCGAGVYGHSQTARRAGETEERLTLLAAWRDAPFFTDAERAALDLGEWITLISSSPAPCGGAVPGRVLAAAAHHFALSDVVTLLLVIVAVNLTDRAGTRNWIN
jgi:AhpD family alkylhydroperoxidase